MSSNGNANYTHIQAHGTASAYEPGFITKAATLGSFNTVQSSTTTNVIDVTVDLLGAISGSLFIIGEQIPPGCVITTVSYDSNNTLDAANIFQFGMAEPVVLPLIGPTTFTPMAAYNAANTAVPGVNGTDPNGTQVLFANTVVPVPVVAGAPLFPAIELGTAAPSPIILPASISVKLVYFCP